MDGHGEVEVIEAAAGGEQERVLLVRKLPGRLVVDGRKNALAHEVRKINRSTQSVVEGQLQPVRFEHFHSDDLAHGVTPSAISYPPRRCRESPREEALPEETVSGTVLRTRQ